MSAIIFASISPHPPIILPTVGSREDRKLARKTIESLELLGQKLKELNPDSIVISSPHEDWGFEVPLYFLAQGFRGKIIKYVTSEETPAFHFTEGQKLYREINRSQSAERIALIASGDLSHCLKEDGSYGFHPHGPRFDRDLIECLKNKKTDRLLKLDEDYPEAGECGLRSICFMLGILKEAKTDYQTEILSYEGPWGVGYLVANFKLSL